VNLTTAVVIAGMVMIFVALFLVFASVGGLNREQTGVNRSLSVLDALTAAPDEMKQELDAPFVDRVLFPLLARSQGLGRKLTPADANDRIREKLEQAGNPPGWTIERVMAGKVVGFAVGLVVSLVLTLLLGVSFVLSLLLVVGASFAGYMAPNMYLYQKSHDRAEQLQRALPDAIDLLTISVESGLGFDAALAQVARNTDGPLAEEFARMLQEMQIGLGRADALRSMGERCHVPDVRSFVSAMTQADAFGIPVGQVLRVQSGEIRVKRRQWAEEAAQKVPVKILVPLIFCILPCLFIAVLGPAGIQIKDSFSGTLS
jgi:tight adherence protein C